MKVGVISGISRGDGGLFYVGTSLYQEMLSPSVEICVFGDGGGFSDEDRTAWGEVPVVPYRTFSAMGLAIGLRRKLRSFNAGLMHQHGLWLFNQFEVLNWQRRHRRPVVISPHGMLDAWALKNSAWKKKLVGRLFANQSLASATCIHALCQSELDSIRAYGLKNPIAQIPNGVELPVLGKKVRKDGPKRLLFIGRIHPKKGIAELLEAWSKSSRDWKLLIAGWDDGGHEARLKNQAEELGLRNIEFIGPQFGEEKENLLRSVDAFILPSFSEGLPMSVLEAWSYSLPAVITEYCNLPEAFDAHAAIKVEPSPESIAEGLKKLGRLSDDELVNMGAQGRRLVEDKFTWPSIAENMRKVYEWCLTGENPPACMDFFDG